MGNIELFPGGKKESNNSIRSNELIFKEKKKVYDLKWRNSSLQEMAWLWQSNFEKKNWDISLFLSLSLGRKSQMEEVQDELVHRLTIGRSAAQRKFHVPRPNIPVVNITYDSSPEDVKAWLQSKGFNPV